MAGSWLFPLHLFSSPIFLVSGTFWTSELRELPTRNFHFKWFYPLSVFSWYPLLFHRIFTYFLFRRRKNGAPGVSLLYFRKGLKHVLFLLGAWGFHRSFAPCVAINVFWHIPAILSVSVRVYAVSSSISVTLFIRCCYCNFKIYTLHYPSV